MALFTLIIAMILFSLVEGRWPSLASARWWRRPVATDIGLWLVHPLLIANSLLVAAAAAVALMRLVGERAPLLTLVRARVGGWPGWVGFVAAFVATDFLSYWVHRVYHRVPFLWAFHVVHHSSEPVDWLSAARLHPLSQAVNTVAISLTLLLAGFSLSTVTAANATVGLISTFAHANVKWSLGPLGQLLVSPPFHRRHHARADGSPYNYGGALSVWDRIFATRAPADSAIDATTAQRFGADDAPPATLMSLLLHPLARRAPERS